MAEKQKKSGGGRKIGRNTDKAKLYRTGKTKVRNKLKRILQSNGVEAATKYAEDKEIWGYLKKLLEGR